MQVRRIQTTLQLFVQNAAFMQKDDSCLWFGVPGRCNVYNILLLWLVLCSPGDLVVSIGMMALGSESSKKRCASRPLVTCKKLHNIINCRLDCGCDVIVTPWQQTTYEREYVDRRNKVL